MMEAILSFEKPGKKGNLAARGAISFALTDAVQFRAMARVDYDEKTAYNLCDFLESIFTKSN